MATETISWGASSDPAVVGYILRWSVSGAIDYSVPGNNLGNVTSVVLPLYDMPKTTGSMTVGITAVDDLGDESSPQETTFSFDFTEAPFPPVPVPSPPGSLTAGRDRPDVYIEMCNVAFWETYGSPHTPPEQTEIPKEFWRIIDPNDYDGNLSWWFDINGYNEMSSPYTVSLVDADNPSTVFASIEIPGSTPDHSTYSLSMKTFRAQFTPPAQATTFAIKLVNPAVNEKVTLGSMRIIIKQDRTATKTMIQIPLGCLGDWGSLYSGWQGLGHTYAKDFYAYGESDAAYDDCRDQYDCYAETGLWRYKASELSTISKIVFEATGGSPRLKPDDPPSADSLYIALFDETANTMVSGSELYWAPDSDISRQRVELDLANFTDGHEYSIRWRVVDNGGIGAQISYEHNLYIWLNPINAMSVWQRVGVGEYQDYAGDNAHNFCSDEARLLFSKKSGYDVFFENVSLSWGWGGTLAVNPDELTNEQLYPYAAQCMFYALYGTGALNDGQGGGIDVADSRLWWTEAEANNLIRDNNTATPRSRKRSPALSLVDGDYYQMHEPNGENYLFQQQAFLVFVQNSETVPEAINLFIGNISDIEIGRTYAKIKAKNIVEYLNVPWPRMTYGPHCAWRLYDAGCGLNKTAFTVSGKVTGNGTILAFNTDLAAADNYFDMGVIYFTSGINVPSYRTVRSFAGNQVTLVLPLLKPPSANDEFMIYPGCDHTIGQVIQTSGYTTANNTAIIEVSNLFAMEPGMLISGPTLLPGTTIIAIEAGGANGNQIDISQAATGDSGNATFIVSRSGNGGCAKFNNTGNFRGMPTIPVAEWSY